MGIIFATVHVQTRHVVSVRCRAPPRDVSKGHFLTPFTNISWQFGGFFCGQISFDGIKMRLHCYFFVIIVFFINFCGNKKGVDTRK